MDVSFDTDILIIGGGIAGSALACALRDSGLGVIIVEKRAAPLDTARGDHIQPSVIDILDRWGVLEDLIARGAQQRRGTRWFDSAGALLADVAVTSLPLKHPHFLFLNHEMIGQSLLERATTNPQFKLLRPSVRWNVKASGDRWEAEIVMPGQARVRIDAALLVGADGTGSMLRKRLGIQESLYRYVHPIAVLFGQQKTVPKQRSLDVHLSDSRMVSVIPRIGGECKIGFPVASAELAKWRVASSDELCHRLRELTPAVDLLKANFGAIYPPVAMQTDHWVVGNAVLMGDACHAMHPARSMGMNTCIRAADALATRLCPLSKPWSAEQIAVALADYEASFRPGVDALLDSNHASGMQMDTIEGGGFIKLATQLRKIAADPILLEAQAWQSAGQLPDAPSRHSRGSGNPGNNHDAQTTLRKLTTNQRIQEPGR